MIGTTERNNDVFFFFEADEFIRLPEEIIRGIYINQESGPEIGQLEAELDDEFCRRSGERIWTIKDKGDDERVYGMRVLISQRGYEIIKEKGSIGVHDGFRHTNIIDASREGLPDRYDVHIYQFCKRIEAKQNQSLAK